MGSVRGDWSFGWWNVIDLWSGKKSVHEYCLASKSRTSRASSSVRSNENETGFPLASWTNSVREHTTLLGKNPLRPQLHLYCCRGGSKVSLSPRISQKSATVYKPPVDMELPSSRIGFESWRGLPKIFTKKMRSVILIGRFRMVRPFYFLLVVLLRLCSTPAPVAVSSTNTLHIATFRIFFWIWALLLTFGSKEASRWCPMQTLVLSGVFQRALLLLLVSNLRAYEIWASTAPAISSSKRAELDLHPFNRLLFPLTHRQY